MLAFGAHLTGFNMINYFGRNLDNILIGWRWGSVSLGLYSKAYSLLLLPIQQISAPLTAVAIPALSRLQKEPERFRTFYRKGLALATMVSMPIVGFSFVASEEVIYIVLGQQWTGIVPIFRVLSIGAFLGTTYGPGTGWVYVALGNVRRQLVVGAFSTGLLLLAFVAGLPWGPIGVAAAFSLHSLFWRIPSVLICFRGTFLTLTDFMAPIWRPSVASISATVLGVVLAASILKNLGIPARLFCEFISYTLTYLLCWMLLPGGKSILVEAFGLARDVIRKKRPV
jgi:O-antigen/teichoic acid export membrane protein